MCSISALKTHDVDIGVLGFNYWYPRGFDYSRIPKVLDDFYMNSGWNGILSWYTAPQTGPGKDSWLYVGLAEQMRSYAKDRREREDRKIHILPSDKMVRQMDTMQMPQRNCGPGPDGAGCIQDAHFGCGILARYPDPIQVSLSHPGSTCQKLTV